MKWLGLGISAWMLGGCVIPQEEDYLSSLPVRLNHPLRIVEQQAQPPERIIHGYGSDFCELEFSVIVEDPDIPDTIVAHWYVDYDASQTRVDAENTIKPQNKPVRDERASFRMRFTDLNRLNIPGDHVVEVVVTDTSLVGREAQPKNTYQMEDGTDYRDPGYTATYAWFVRTESGGGCQ